MYQHRESNLQTIWSPTPIEQEIIDYQQQLYGTATAFRSPAIRAVVPSVERQHPTIKRYIVTP